MRFVHGHISGLAVGAYLISEGLVSVELLFWGLLGLQLMLIMADVLLTGESANV